MPINPDFRDLSCELNAAEARLPDRRRARSGMRRRHAPRKEEVGVTLSIELTQEQEAALLESARRLNLAPEVLVAAAVRDFLGPAAPPFRAAAEHVLTKNRELYRRLA